MVFTMLHSNCKDLKNTMWCRMRMARSCTDDYVRFRCNRTCNVCQDEADERHRVALVFFGKHGADETRSHQMARAQTGSLALIRRSYQSWRSKLLDANPGSRFDVFIHSWSPEVADELTRLWGDTIVAQHHEPTRYISEHPGTTDLRFRCEAVQVLCERTLSQLLSISKALQLKRESELEQGAKYEIVLVSRHDLMLAADWRLPEYLWAAEAIDVWLPRQCPACGNSRNVAVPHGCKLVSEACEYDFAPKLKRTYLALDWFFAAASPAADTMGDLVRHHGAYSRVLRQWSDRSDTHHLWPYHALHAGLRLNWGLLLHQRDFELARYGNQNASAPTDPGSAFRCYYALPQNQKAAARPGGVNLTRLPHPPFMNRQCPYEQALLCRCGEQPPVGREPLLGTATLADEQNGRHPLPAAQGQPWGWDWANIKDQGKALNLTRRVA